MGSSISMCVCSIVSDSLRSHGLKPRLFCPWISQEQYGPGCQFPSPEDLPDPRMETAFPVSLVLVGGSFTTEPPGKPLYLQYHMKKVITSRHFYESIKE